MAYGSPEEFLAFNHLRKFAEDVFIIPQMPLKLCSLVKLAVQSYTTLKPLPEYYREFDS